MLRIVEIILAALFAILFFIVLGLFFGKTLASRAQSKSATRSLRFMTALMASTISTSGILGTMSIRT